MEMFESSLTVWKTLWEKEKKPCNKQFPFPTMYSKGLYCRHTHTHTKNAKRKLIRFLSQIPIYVSSYKHVLKSIPDKNIFVYMKISNAHDGF